ncbi:hypothetical protein Verru16b_02821 [Lacunisphaera limnophila]|uniref:Uncharacterized protein n=1 Tax=Lacunisphaera limnophila TaxID=1838286 RepID=A0A1D8AXY1_9BACT|nr:hypothetical protein [Lacunisphaera limnophila]AOS45734.1 hypothetical protein Verru16b_02821 [Lacunisphaera limnophila]
MQTNPDGQTLDRHLTFQEIVLPLRQRLRTSLLPLAALCVLIMIPLWYDNNPGLLGYILIALGAWLSLAVWSAHGMGLPMLPMLVLQTLFTFALPIITRNETLDHYPAELLLPAGLDVLLFCLTMTGTWALLIRQLQPGAPYCYALQGFQKDGVKKLRGIGLTLISVFTVYRVAQMMHLTDPLFAALPSGSQAIVSALTSAISVCGFFLVAMLIGGNSMGSGQRVAFWLMFALNFLMLSAGFVLSAGMLLMGAVFIGLLWGSGRVPWRYFAFLAIILSFLNFGKFVMREKYWDPQTGSGMQEVGFADMPAVYSEWAEASYLLLTGSSDSPASQTGFGPKEEKEGQSLLSRVNNMQNLLFVMETIKYDNAPLLYGETYTLIPPLLIPRFFWPDKPRAHEGQILLNVHFGRQDLQATFGTYIAWGLLPEACGNFGPIYGAILLGICLGALAAWIEVQTSNKLLFSLEGLLGLVIFMGVLNSYEMVASVLVTSVFQSLFPVILGCSPFVERQSTVRPDAY